jgi:hypothetical protein
MTPRDRVAQLYPQTLDTILVAFYDMHGLQWDYCLIPATTRELVEVRLGYIARKNSVGLNLTLANHVLTFNECICLMTSFPTIFSRDRIETRHSPRLLHGTQSDHTLSVISVPTCQKLPLLTRDWSIPSTFSCYCLGAGVAQSV